MTDRAQDASPRDPAAGELVAEVMHVRWSVPDGDFAVLDAVSDAVSCDPGDDLAYTDGMDLIAGDCEEIILGSHLDACHKNPYQPALLGG